MGLSGFLTALSEAGVDEWINLDGGKDESSASVHGTRVGVDALCWLHRGLYAAADGLHNGNPEERRHVNYVINMTNMLKDKGLDMILVFDGRPLPPKLSVMKERYLKRCEARVIAEMNVENGDSKAARKNMQKGNSVNSNMICLLVHELKKNKIKFMFAPYEADAQLAYLQKNKIIDAVITEDSDSLLFGTGEIWTKMKREGTTFQFKKIKLCNVLRAEDSPFCGFTIKHLRWYACLTGCDYLKKLKGIGPVLAKRIVTNPKVTSIRKLFDQLNLFENLRNQINDEYIRNFEKSALIFKYQTVWDYNPQDPTKTEHGQISLRPFDSKDFVSCVDQQSLLTNAGCIGTAIRTANTTTLSSTSSSSKSNSNALLESEDDNRLDFLGKVLDQRTMHSIVLGQICAYSLINQEQSYLIQQRLHNMLKNKEIDRERLVVASNDESHSNNRYPLQDMINASTSSEENQENGYDGATDSQGKKNLMVNQSMPINLSKIPGFFSEQLVKALGEIGGGNEVIINEVDANNTNIDGSNLLEFLSSDPKEVVNNIQEGVLDDDNSRGGNAEFDVVSLKGEAISTSPYNKAVNGANLSGSSDICSSRSGLPSMLKRRFREQERGSEISWNNIHQGQDQKEIMEVTKEIRSKCNRIKGDTAMSSFSTANQSASSSLVQEVLLEKMDNFMEHGINTKRSDDGTLKDMHQMLPMKSVQKRQESQNLENSAINPAYDRGNNSMVGSAVAVDGGGVWSEALNAIGSSIYGSDNSKIIDISDSASQDKSEGSQAEVTKNVWEEKLKNAGFNNSVYQL